MSGYSTRVAGTTITASAHNTDVRDQVVSQFASAAARTSAIGAPTENMVSALADVNTLGVYSGSAWSTIGPVHGALTTWTPTVTQGATPVFTNSSTYSRVGRRVIGDAKIAVTSGTGTAANDVVFGLPVASDARYQPNTSVIGTGLIFDSSASLIYGGVLIWISTTTAKLMNTGGVATTNQFYGTASFTAALAVNDQVTWNFNYEAGADA